MTVAERLAALGLELPGVVPPIGAYVPAVQSGPFVYTSGQLPSVAGTIPAEYLGKLGGDVTVEIARKAAAQAALNAVAAISALLGGLEGVEKVVKVVGFVASHPDFTAQPDVINGASELLQNLFGDAGRHARSAIGVASLPRNVCVEVEMIVQVRQS